MKKILVIGKVWPEPVSSAAGSRMMQLLEIFKSAGFDVHFSSAAGPGDFSEDLSHHNINCHSLLLNDAGFDDFVSALDPDLVLFDRFTSEEQFGWRVAKHCPGALRMLDTEDLHFLRAARHKALNEKRMVTPGDLHSETCYREIAAIYRCDLSLIISQYEMQLLSRLFKVDEALLHYIPLMVKDPSLQMLQQLPDFSERKHFISIGNFLHEPNRDAVSYLKKDIWPLIRKKLPETEIHIYGAYAGDKILQWHDPENGFLVKGRAEQVQPVMRLAKVCLAPLRFGAGLKGKLMDAMENGTPNVTTAIGAEGMQLILETDLPDQLLFPEKNSNTKHQNKKPVTGPAMGDWSGMIAETPEAFAAAAVSLYTSGDRWEAAQINGIKILTALFDHNKHTSPLLVKLETISKNLVGHRLQNFTGGMLMQHTAQGTKYMSLWIEAKNKIQKQAE